MALLSKSTERLITSFRLWNPLQNVMVIRTENISNRRFLLLVLPLSLGIGVALTLSTNVAIVLTCLIIVPVAMFLEPYIGLLVYIAAVYIRPQEFISGLGSIRLMLLLGMAVGGMWLLHIIVYRGKKGLPKTPQNWLMVALLCAMIASHLSHLYLHGVTDTIDNFKDVIVVYFLMVGLITSMRKLKVVIWLILLLTLVMAIQGIVQFYTGVGLAGETMILGRIRGIGIFNDPNDLALALVIIIPILLTYLLGPTSIAHRFISAIAIGLVVYAIFLTDSRGGWLALLAAIFLYFQRKLGKTGMVIGIILAALLLTFGPSRMGDLSAEESSAQGRLIAWHSGILMLKAYPLFGVGMGNYFEYHNQTAHNSLMLILGETGLLGAFFWIALIYMSFKCLRAVQGQNNQLLSLAHVLQVSLGSFLVAAFFLSRTYNILLYILIALAICIYKISEREYNLSACEATANQSINFTTRDLRNVFVIELGGLFLIYAMVKVL